MYFTIGAAPVGLFTCDFACSVHHQPWPEAGPVVTLATVPYHQTSPVEYVDLFALAQELGSRVLLPPPAGGIRCTLPALHNGVQLAACESTETALLIPASASVPATCCALARWAFRWFPAVKSITPPSAVARKVMTSSEMTSAWPRSFRNRMRAARVMRPPRSAASSCRRGCRGPG